MDLLNSEASAKQCLGHFYILVIICIWPFGFRTAPRVALKRPQKTLWNAQSPASEASEEVCQPMCHPSLSRSALLYKMKVFLHAWCWFFFACCTLLADRWKPPAQRWGSLSFEAPLPPLHILPPPLFSPLRSPSRKRASILPSQAPEPGSRQWKPSPVTTERQISPCIWHNNTDWEGKEAQMQYSYTNYKAGSDVTWHCGT